MRAHSILCFAKTSLMLETLEPLRKTMMDGKEVHKKLNRFKDIIPYGINAIRRSGIEIKEIDADFTFGITLIMFFSYLESVMDGVCPVPLRLPKKFPRHTQSPFIKNIDYWVETYDKSKSRWYAWEEFENMYRLRHCFAHNNGKLLSGHSSRIKAFHKKLDNGGIQDRDGNSISRYFDIESNTIKIRSLMRCKILVMEFLVLVGEISPFQLNNGSWVRF